MSFLEPTLENFQKHIAKLKTDSTPEWGSMTAQKMVEHLSDWTDLCIGNGGDFPIEIPEDKVKKAQAFLFSEYALPRNFKVKFLPDGVSHRNPDLETAIKEFEVKWNIFERFHAENPKIKIIHPNFGSLDYKHILALHSKHMTHHFEQFNLI